MPHVHIHVLPRREGDFEPNDAVYEAIDEASKQMGRCLLVCSSSHDGSYCSCCECSSCIRTYPSDDAVCSHDLTPLCAGRRGPENLNLDKERVARTPEVMAAEATELRALFED